MKGGIGLLAGGVMLIVAALIGGTIVSTPRPSYGAALTCGLASYYGTKSGSRTASGERFRPDGLTAASRTLPFGALVLVTDVATGRRVTVRINDRGPYVRGRMIDLSRGAARRLGIIGRGVARVCIRAPP